MTRSAPEVMHEAEAREHDVIREERVCAEHDVDLAALDAGRDLAPLGRAQRARDELRAHSAAREQLAELSPDIYMTLFHTARAAGVNAQEYLLAPLNNTEQMQANPSAWLP